MAQIPLTLAALLAFDPSHRRRDGGEARACCPLCGQQKPVDAAHRSLSYNTTTGLFHCHRCNANGLLIEWRPEPSAKGALLSRRDRQRQEGRRRFALDPPPLPPVPGAVLPKPVDAAPAPAPPPVSIASPVATVTPVAVPSRVAVASSVPATPLSLYAAARALSDDPGARYLTGQRHLPLSVCEASGVRFLPEYLGRPAVLFPVHDASGQIVAVQGRYIDGRENPRMRTVGERKRGVFATAGALAARPPDLASLILVEAPIDALSLAACGFAAVALCGCEGVPHWLRLKAAFTQVFLAFDADEAGDRATERLSPEFAGVGASVFRLRPLWAKDWNALLIEKGPDAVRAAVALAFDADDLSGPGWRIGQGTSDPAEAIATMYRRAQAHQLPKEHLILPGGLLIANPNRAVIALVSLLRQLRAQGAGEAPEALAIGDHLTLLAARPAVE